MLNHGSKKNGYTLVEVLVVVTIMGVLSSMGVAGLRGAVINSRMKDNALNVTAFLERVANEANRMSKRICVKKDNDQRISAYVANQCDGVGSDGSDVFDTYELEAPAKFECGDGIDMSEISGFSGGDWAQNGALFVPRIGLSAAPAEGYVCMQYGSHGTYAVAIKKKNNNMIVPMWRSGAYWSKL